MKTNILKIFIISAFAWGMPWPIFGAEINFNPAVLATPQAQPFTITILVDTDQDSLNTIDGTVMIAKELGDDIQITDSGSIITYWIEQPTKDTENRTIKFSGAVPGGYKGENGILFSLVIPSYSGPKLTNAITVTNLHGYQNDGLGTPMNISSKQISIGETQGRTDAAISDQLYIDDKKQDAIPPETFSPQVSRDERVFDNKWFITFATTDKQSGIDHYELQESQSGRIDSGNWKTVSSPYVLEDQGLQSFIYITAIDRQGNERVIKVFPKNDSPWWFRYGRDMLIVAGIILLIIIGYWYHKVKDKKDLSVVNQKK